MCGLRGLCVHVCSAVGLWVLYMCVIVGVYMSILSLQQSSGYV